MCLSAAWFMAAPQRAEERARDGLSVEAATRDLATYHSTIYPVAVETANWIASNWTSSQIDRLDQRSREILDLIVSKRLY